MEILKAAYVYWKLGLSIAPAKIGSKHPSIKWKPYQQKQLPEEEIPNLFSDNTDIALITGSFNKVVVVDADSAEAVEWCDKNLPATPATQQSPRKTGKHYFYQYVEGVKSKVNFFNGPGGTVKEDPRILDIRGENGIIMLAPSKGYGLSCAPEQLLDLPNFPIELFPIASPVGEPAQPISLSPADQLQALGLISKISPDCNRDTWRQVGMALKSLSADMFPVWDIWSRSANNNYPHEKNYEQWQSFTPGEYNKGNLISLATASLPIIDGSPQDFLADLKTMNQVKATEFDPINWVVKGMFPTGMTIIGGRPKVGKSFLCLDIVSAVAEGGKVMGSFTTTQGTTLYVSLEDFARRINSRAKSMDRGSDNCYLMHECPRIGSGFCATMRQAKEKWEDLNLVVVDTMAHILPEKKSGRKNDYEFYYPHLTRIQSLSHELGIGIVLIHHLKKGAEENILDQFMGSVAFQGTADTLCVIERKMGKDEGAFQLTGRDLGDKYYKVKFNDEKLLWEYEGQGFTKSDNENDQLICQIISESKDGAMNHKEILDAFEAAGRKPGTAKTRIRRMAQRKHLYQDAEGYYHVQFDGKVLSK